MLQPRSVTGLAGHHTRRRRSAGCDRQASGLPVTRDSPLVLAVSAGALLARPAQEGGHMLDLYHAEPAANSLKTLIAIKEKGVAFISHFINLHKFEQHEPRFVTINPNGQVPALVHDGKVISESTVINEYLDDAFPGTPLRPADPYWRARMRIWTKFVDEYFCPALSFIAWHHMIRNITDKLSPEEFEAKIARIPLKEQQDKWRTSAKQGYTKEQLDNWGRQVRTSIERMEHQLGETPWLAGTDFSLADVSCFAMAASMPRMSPNLVNAQQTPRFMDWHSRVEARPGVQAALAMPNPVRDTLETSRSKMSGVLG
jgi:glutathione S-transferase